MKQKYVYFLIAVVLACLIAIPVGWHYGGTAGPRFNWLEGNPNATSDAPEPAPDRP